MTHDFEGVEKKQETQDSADAKLSGKKESSLDRKKDKKSGGLFSWFAKPKKQAPNKNQNKPIDSSKGSVDHAKTSGLKAVAELKTQDTQDDQFWRILAVISGVLILISMLALSYFVPSSNAFVKNVGHLRLLSQQIIANTESAVGSFSQEEVELAFKSLEQDQVEFNEILSGMSLKTSPQIQSVANDWQVANQQISNILKNRSQVVELNKTVSELYPAIDEVKVFYNEVVNQMLNAGISANQTVKAKNQIILAERILRSVGVAAVGSQGTFDSADDFLTVANFFNTTLEGQLNGNSELGVQRISQPQIRQQLAIIKDINDEVLLPSVKKASGYAQGIEKVRQSATTTINKSRSIAQSLSGETTRVVGQLGVYLSAFLLVLSFITLLFAIYKILQLRATSDRKRSESEALRQRKEAEVEMQRAEKIQKENDRNQTAILRLLDELGDLADGDLTVHATVSEDFTGAIADSVNFAIDQLRLLVSAINSTAIEVTKSSEQTQNTAMQLAESSEHQAQEIAGASAAINEMAVSIDQVSANAVESATVADRSVAIAYNGAEVVQRSIDGMGTIREQIQETAKRIKRLGESSQEIGDIISLINDIADQTNILALNAAIQASSAGEAGRGFAVVADEVQRLAERSANATKQIETLVKTIQEDTNEAVSSMELTTAEVVRGAKLAKDAGEALEEVQTVSNTLADLIQNISNAARQQAASAGHISNTMNIIQEITTQTTAGTIATARSVGELNDMANVLKESVSGFTLPEDEQAALGASF